MDQSHSSPPSFLSRTRFLRPSPPQVNHRSHLSSGFVYTAEKVESVGNLFERKSREKDQLRRENGIYLMLVVGKVMRKGKGRRLTEGFGCLKRSFSRYGLTIKRKLDASFPRQSVLALNEAVSRPYLRLSQLAFQAIKATPSTSPLKNYSKGLSKLHHSFLRDCRSSHYRSVSSKTLSLTLVRDFILNVLDAVVTGAQSREKAWAWSRIRYIRVNKRYQRGSKLAEPKRTVGKERNSRLEARISIGLSKLHPVYLLKKHSFSCWKSAFLIYCRRKLLKSKAILAVQCMCSLIRARLDAGWREIMTLSREIELKGTNLLIALSKIVAKDAFSPSFHRIQACSQLKSRQFQALSRAFQRIHSIERMQTAARIQRLYRKLAECRLTAKRRATKVQNAARGLGITLRGMTRERLQLAFEKARLYFPHRANRISPVPPLYSPAKLLKAIDFYLKSTLKASFQHWKSHSYSLSVQNYKQFIKSRSNRGSTYTTCPQTMASQREMASGHTRRGDSSSAEYSSSLVSELIRSQYGVQAKVEAMLRQSPARSPLRSSVVRGAKERVKGLYVAKVLSRLLGLKWAFGRLKSKKTWGEREKLGVEGMRRGVSNALYRLRSSVFHLLQSLPSRQSLLFSPSIRTLNTHLKRQQLLTLTHTLSTWKLNSKVLTQRIRRRGKVLGSVVTAAVKRMHSSYQRSALQSLRSFPTPSYFEVLSALATIRKQTRNCHRTTLTQALQYSIHRLWKTHSKKTHHRNVYSNEITRSSISRGLSPVEETQRTYRVVLPAPVSIHQYIDDVVEVVKNRDVEAYYTSNRSFIPDQVSSPTPLLTKGLRTGAGQNRSRSQTSVAVLHTEIRCKNCGRKKRSQTDSKQDFYSRPASTTEDLEYYLSAQ